MQIEITAEYLASQGLSESFPERFWNKVNKNGPVQSHCPELGHCWNWIASVNSNGYGQIAKGIAPSSPILAPRASWIIHTGPIPYAKLVLHKCDNPPCVRPDHLFLGEQLDNMRDCAKKGRNATNPNYGEDHHNHKLSNKEVLEMRSSYPRLSITEIAIKFGVSKYTTERILRRQAWPHLEPSISDILPPPPRARMSEEEVRQARIFIAAGDTLKEAGRKLGFGVVAIWKVVHGQSHSNV